MSSSSRSAVGPRRGGWPTYSTAGRTTLPFASLTRSVRMTAPGCTTLGGVPVGRGQRRPPPRRAGAGRRASDDFHRVVHGCPPGVPATGTTRGPTAIGSPEGATPQGHEATRRRGARWGWRRLQQVPRRLPGDPRRHRWQRAGRRRHACCGDRLAAVLPTGWLRAGRGRRRRDLLARGAPLSLLDEWSDVPEWDQLRCAPSSPGGHPRTGRGAGDGAYVERNVEQRRVSSTPSCRAWPDHRPARQRRTQTRVDVRERRAV